MTSARPKTYVLVDIDGTIADVRHRLHHIERPGRKNWKAFFEGMDRDTPIADMIEKVKDLAAGHAILIVTGRPASYRARTERWLKANGIPYERLFMRRNGDHRPDFEAKRAVLDAISPSQIVLAIDDRPPVCDMWEKAGIKCLRIESAEENQEVNKIYEKQPSGAKKKRK